MDKVEIPNVQQPAPDVLTGGQPTMAQLQALAEAGARTVVDLRAEEPSTRALEKATVEAAGMRYISIPVPGSSGVNYDNAAALGAILRDPALRPLVVHCGSGNRVGALVALDADAQGAVLDDAIARGREHGLESLEGRVRELISAT